MARGKWRGNGTEVMGKRAGSLWHALERGCMPAIDFLRGERQTARFRRGLALSLAAPAFQSTLLRVEIPRSCFRGSDRMSARPVCSA